MSRYDEAYKLLSDYLEEATDNSGQIKSLQNQKEQLIQKKENLSEQIQTINKQIALLGTKIADLGGNPETTKP